MFIKLTTSFNNALLLDTERIISVKEEPHETFVTYAEPQGTGENLKEWCVKETVDEILEKIEDAEGGFFDE